MLLRSWGLPGTAAPWALPRSGFVDPADEPVIRRFFVDMIGHLSELIRKERGA